MRNVDPARFPNVVEALREAGLDPTTELVPVSPAAPLRDGRRRHRPRRRAPPCPACYAVGETRLHRPARRQPARVQLALASASCSARRAAPPASTSRRAAAAGAPSPAQVEPLVRPARDPRGACGAAPGSSATPTACAACSTTRTRSPGSSPRRRSQRQESRGAHAPARLPGTAIRRSTGATRSSRRDDTDVVHEPDARSVCVGFNANSTFASFSTTQRQVQSAGFEVRGAEALADRRRTRSNACISSAAPSTGAGA